ncbi:MAG TPA: hypothetical protein VFP20_00205 [Bacteroidales bacterium]|nr:hypothetical protein [Bacteroidales bacterium]
MKLKRSSFLILLAGSLIHFTSCTNSSIPERSLEMASDVNTLIQAESMNDMALHLADVYVNFLETIKNNDPKDTIYNLPNGAYLQVDIDGVIVRIKKEERSLHPRNIFIDFGTGVNLRLGNVFKGQIHVRETAAMSETNAKRTYVFSNLELNGHTIKGTNTRTYLGVNSDLQPMWKIDSNDSITFQDGRTLRWNAERTLTRVNVPSSAKPTDFDENVIDSIRYDATQQVSEKMKSMMLWDQLYSVYGVSNGVNADGKAFTTRILEGYPLHIGMGFPCYISGKCLLKEDKDLLMLDFGNKKRDFLLTITLHGLSLEYDSLDGNVK